MDEFDEISEEELRLAAVLAEHLDRGTRVSAGVGDEFEELATHAALLRASKNLDLGATQVTSGRAEVEAFAQKSLTKKAHARPKRAWLMWLPLPAIGVLVFVFGLSPSAERKRHAPELRAEATPATEGLQSAAAPKSADGETDTWHRGEVPPALLKAQTLALTSRLNGSERDAEEWRATLDREMRGYRARLLARLDVEER